MKTLNLLICLSLCAHLSACGEDDPKTPSAGAEAGTAAGAEAGTAAGAEAGTAAGAEAGTAAGAEAGTAAGAEAGTAAGAEAGAEAGMDAPMGCGEETFYGRCDGATLVYCDEENDEVFRVDCAANNNELVSQSCALINDEYGYDCQSAVGTECYLDGYPNLCAGESSGCVFTQSEEPGVFNSSCVEMLEPCSSNDFMSEDSPALCNGDQLYIGCNIDQPWSFDCSSFGGTCGEGACQVPDGSICDDTFLKCAEGFVCTDLSESGFGTCAAEG